MGTPSAATVAATTELSPCTIMGAGLVGSLLALYLAQRGHMVDVYERRADPRLSGAVEGHADMELIQ